MLVNKVSALGAVMPKEVLNGNAAQNFKTKPMGYDSVSFGVARVPAGNPDIFYEKLNGSAESFEKAIQDAVPNREKVFKFLKAYGDNILTYKGREYPPLSQAAAEKKDPAYLKAIIDTLFDKNNPEDNRMLARVMAEIDYSKIKSDSVKELCSETIKQLLSTSTSGKPDDIPNKLISEAFRYKLVNEDDFKKPGAKYARDKALFSLVYCSFNKSLAKMIKSYSGNKEELIGMLTEYEGPATVWYNDYRLPIDEMLSAIQLAAQGSCHQGGEESLLTIISSFDKTKPEDNVALAKILATIKTSKVPKLQEEGEGVSLSRMVEYNDGIRSRRSQGLYLEAVKFLTLDCKDVPDDLSIQLINNALKASFMNTPQFKNDKQLLLEGKDRILKNPRQE